MTRFAGDIGFGITVETSPGVWEEIVYRRKYYGDIDRAQSGFNDTEKVVSDIRVNNSFRVVADAFATNNFFNMRFVEWAGVCWTITNVEVRYPRLVLTIGGVYNGPTESAPDGPVLDPLG